MALRSILPLLFMMLTTNLVGRDLYWIGETGNWERPENWSLSSGGSPNSFVPAKTDNVFFDDNSFHQINQVVSFNTVEVNTITINSTKTPIFNGQTLTVAQKIHFLSPLAFNSDIVLENTSSSSGTINSGGMILNGNFSVVSGDWELMNHLILADDKVFYAACNRMNINGFTLKAGTISGVGVKLNATNANIHPIQKIDLSKATRKGGDFQLFSSESVDADLGDWVASTVTTKATCGSLTVTATVTSNYNGAEISCTNACDAEITVALSGTSTGPYGYSLNSATGPWQTSNILTGVCAGNQTVFVIDSSQTTSPGNYVVCFDNINPSQPFSLNYIPGPVINPSCPDVCDGSTMITPNNGTGTITVVWDNGETGNNPVMLCTGANTVTLTDDNGCELIADIVINSPLPIVYDVNITELTCNGDADAAISIANETGGNGGPYSYSYSPAPAAGQNTNNGVGFSSGTVTITVSDVDGCQQDSIITIEEPPVLTADFTDVEDLNCFGICNGQISALPSGGVPGYSFEWFDNATGLTTSITDSVATGLCAGDYFVVVTDANGCAQTSGVATVTEPPAFNLNLSKIDVACLDSCTGIVIAAPMGGTPNYNFSWIDIATGASVGTTPSVSELCAGQYEITITDALGCVSTPDTLEILNGLPIDIVFTSISPTCYDICDGEITATPTNGAGFTYSWSNGGNMQTINGLCVQDEYIVTVTTDSGCVEVDTFNFPAPVQFNIVTNQTDLQCFGDTDANIVVDVIEGGNGPVFTYDWTVVASPGSAIDGDFTDSIFNLTAQNYELIITDGPGGCDTTLTFTISSPPELTVTAVDAADLLCANVCNGQVSALPVGGTPPYTFEWFDNLTGLSTGITDSIATGLCEGDYFVVVTDGNNCSATSAVIQINSPLPLSLTLNKVDLVCVDICNGEASSVVTGGTINYVYNWVNITTTTNAGNTPNLTGLCPGEYELTVTDANNCPSVVDTITILNALPIGLNLTGTDPSCYNDCDGQISVATTNSSGFSYVWTPGTVTGQGTAVASDLCANVNYVVEVTDVNGCIEKDSLILNAVPEYDIVAIISDVTCFGDGNGSISVTVNSGGNGLPYTFIWASVNGDPFVGQGTSNISSLLAGDYTVTIADGLNCDTTLTFTVTSPADLVVNATDIIQISCFGLCDGQISALPSGGNPGYTFAWINNANGAIISVDSILQNLCAGDYYLRVTDVNGCVDSSSVITILEPPTLIANASATDISCHGICDGTAQVTVIGGTPVFTYSWTNIANNANIGNSNSISGLCPGEYQIVVSDATGCSTEPDTVEVLDVLEFDVSITGTDPTCPNDCNGTIVGATTNGIAPFTWTPVPSSGQNTATANYDNLCPGFYTITVEDNNGCIAEDTVTLHTPLPYDITVTQNNLLCEGDNQGSISVLVNSGGDGGPYTYNWLPPGLTGAGTNAVSNLSAGPYQVLISDGNCDTTLTFTITEPDELIVNASVISQSLCAGDCSGSGQVSISGGTPTYNIQWNDPLMQSTPLIANLCPATYQVSVTDDNGCSAIDSITIVESSLFNFSVSSTDVSCFGDCTGSATVSGVSGGTPGYTIQWDDPNNQTNFIATNLCAGTYQATLTDANNCDTIITVIIDEPSVITFTTDVIDTACFGSCDGVVSAIASGGQGPYMYQWFNVNSSVSIGSGSTLGSLCPGDYYANIIDDNGCIVTTDTLSITEFPQIFLTTTSVTDATCGLTDGAITINATGGAGNFTYNWSPGAITGQGTPAITQLGGGVYQAIVTDDNNCTDSISVPVNSGALEILNVSSTDVSCFGLSDGIVDVNFVCLEPNCSINWFNENGVILGSSNQIGGLPAGQYFIELTNGLGCTVIDSITIVEPDEIIVDITSTNILCNGSASGTATVNANLNNLLYNWTPNPNGGQGTNQAIGLAEGLWTVEVSNISGCTVDLAVNITAPPAITIDDIDAQDISCAGINDGSAYVSASGGTPNLTYEWFACGSGLSAGVGSSVSNLSPGDYFVVITDENGCELNSNCVTVDDYQPLLAINTATNATCFGFCNGSISTVASGGNGTYFYQWQDENQVDIVGQTAATINNLCQGNYFLVLTDGNGCTELFGPIDLTQPVSPWDVSIATTDVSCFGECDGSSVLTVTSGNTAPYTFLWNDPFSQNTHTAINLCAGDYQVLITDQANCDTTVTVQITGPSPINLNATQTNVLCADECTGMITLAPSGGAAPYGVSWSNGDGGLSVSNLCAGDITANVIDDLGCTIENTFTISEPTNPLSIVSSFQNISECNQCNGSATVNVTGGTLPYTYVWSEPTVIGQGTNSVSGLCSGVISVTVTDANLCSIVQSFLIQDVNGDSFTLNSTDASCFDVCDGSATIVPTCTVLTCTQAWYDANTGVQLAGTGTSVSNLCGGDYIVELTNGAGCVSGDTFTIDAPDELLIDEVITDISCAGFADGSIVITPSGGSGTGYIFNWTPAPPNGNGTNSALNLSSGVYNIQVTDSDNCSVQEDFSLDDTTAIVLTSSSNNVTCNGFCNGNITIAAQGGYGNYTYQWLDNGTPIVGETNTTIFDLCPGSYNVVVTDASGCSQTLANPIIITEPTQVGVSLTDTDISCFGLCDGTATVVGSGGVGPYIYNWYNSANDLIGQTTPTATALCADSYYAVITDANNCSVTTSSAVVTEPAELVFTVDQTGIECFNDCSGTGSITVTGGVMTYDYEWIDLATAMVIGTNNTIANLCAGSYTIEAIDQNGCSTGVNDVNIVSPNELIVDVFTNNADCNLASGSATTQVTGGLPVYSYQWLDNTQSALAGETNSDLLDVFSGTYYVVVTDDNGCDDTVQVEIIDNPSTILQFDNVQNPSCFGSLDGSIDITVAGNNVPLNFLWNPGGLVVEDPSNLAAGTYNLTITDAQGCESFYDTVLVEPSEILGTPVTTDPTCGECDGEISVTVTGGQGPYDYTWNTGGTNNSLQNLCAGIYELTVQDDNGCEISTPYTLANSADVTAEAIVTPISCYDLCDGEITVNILAGTAPYSVLWLNDGFTGLTQQNLCAGTYFIEVTDAAGCVFPLVVELENPNEIIVTSNMTLPNCGLSDGEISVTSTGGVLPHVYSWNTNQTTPTISNLDAGVYSLIVTDNNGTGCSQDFTFNLSNVTVPQVSLTATDIDCHGSCNGEIQSMTTGGTPTYSYQWFTDDGVLLVGESNPDLLNLCEGSYAIEVTDGNGCIAYATEVINQPSEIILNTPVIDNVSCFGDCDGSISINSFGGTIPYNYAWDDPNSQTTPTASNLCDGTFTVTLTDGNNCQITYIDSIVEPPLLEITIDNITEAKCKETLDGEIQTTITGGTLDYTINWVSSTGLTFNTEDIVGALPMTYFLTVTDANGCIAQDTASIDTAIIVIVDAGPDTMICDLTELNLLATSNQSAADYSWLDNSSATVSDTNFYLTGILSEGTYTFIAQAIFDGCDDTDTIEITVRSPLIIDAGPDVEIILNQSGVIGGDPTSAEPGQIIWAPSIYLSDTSATNPQVIEPQEDGWYYVEFIDSFGCVAIDSVFVDVVPELIVPEGISPNGDNKNDTWVLEFSEDFPDIEVSVYNRWGELLFYDNAGYLVPWDGKYQNKEVPVGTYYYVIELNSELYPEPFVGPLTIMR